jgi:acyl-CoA synthetase (AMP-forming)/AMP-acid ligase II
MTSVGHPHVEARVGDDRVDRATKRPQHLKQLLTRAARFAGSGVDDDGIRTITYAELEERVEGLSRDLREIGVRSGGRVIVDAQRRIETVLAAHAIALADAVYVPFDPALPHNQRARAVDHVEAAAVLCIEEASTCYAVAAPNVPQTATRLDSFAPDTPRLGAQRADGGKRTNRRRSVPSDRQALTSTAKPDEQRAQARMSGARRLPGLPRIRAKSNLAEQARP